MAIETLKDIIVELCNKWWGAECAALENTDPEDNHWESQAKAYREALRVVVRHVRDSGLENHKAIYMLYSLKFCKPKERG